MIDQANLVILGVSIGLSVGIVIACLLFFGIRWFRKRPKLQQSVNERGAAAVPIRTNGFGTSIDYSASLTDSIAGLERNYPLRTQVPWQGHLNKDRFASASGIPRYSYKDVQKATQNFTTILGQGSFGPVYKAVMPNGEIIAAKVLASNSKQGEKEFQTEVLLLGRLHHRNLVNLLGYCVDKGQHMLLYEFMTNGSLENILYNEEKEVLSWDDRLQIALDISHGIEYLHEGAVPPVIHRDLKSANILLDHSMRAKVADFGLSREESFDGRKSGLKGTYGYMDPAYISTNKFTMKSDIYSFGVVIFELITAIHPHQNLMEYVNLAAMSSDGVDEILDKHLVGQCSLEEVRGLARIAHRCLHNSPRKRPSIGEVSPAILKIRQRRIAKSDTMSLVGGDISRVVSRIELQQLELSKMASINVA